MTGMIRTALVTIVALTCLGGATASAGEVAPVQLTLDPSSVTTEGTFGFTIAGFDCGVDIEVTITPTGGSETALVTIPVGDIVGGSATVSGLSAPATPGTYVVEAFDFECQRSAADALEVTQATTTTTTTTTIAATTTTIAGQVAPTTVATTTTAAPATLPATGRSSDALVWAALAALLAGGGLVVVAARRS
jgi:LPXTG-motif cell wall-anchored protein